MKFLKKLGLLLCLLGLVMHVPQVVNWLTLYFGDTMGSCGGLVSFAIGWALLGACLAYSAGIKFQRARIQK
jgi:hypothetical protein